MTSEEQLEIKKNAEKKILFYPVFKQINTIFLHWLIFFIISLLIFKNFFFFSLPSNFMSASDYYYCSYSSNPLIFSLQDNFFNYFFFLSLFLCNLSLFLSMLFKKLRMMIAMSVLLSLLWQ